MFWIYFLLTDLPFLAAKNVVIASAEPSMSIATLSVAAMELISPSIIISPPIAIKFFYSTESTTTRTVRVAKKPATK